MMNRQNYRWSIATDLFRLADAHRRAGRDGQGARIATAAQRIARTICLVEPW